MPLSLAQLAAGDAGQAHATLIAAIQVIPEKHPWMGRLRDEWQTLLESPRTTD